MRTSFTPIKASSTPATERKPGLSTFQLAEGEDEHTTIYLANFERCLRIIDRDDYAELFTQGERDLAQRFGCLSRPSRGLYTRMLQRKGPWFRTDSLLRYKELGGEDEEFGHEEESAWRRAQSALNEMGKCGFITGIGDDTRDLELDEVLGAVECCLKLEEIRTLVGRLTKKSVAGLSRKGVINALRDGLQGQKTMTQFFGAQKNEVPNRGEQVIREVAKMMTPSHLSAVKGSSILLSQLSNISVRLSRRIMRLVFLTSSGGYGASTSVLFPVVNPALLADFGKVKYAKYECKVGHSVFPTRRRFLQWEAGQELRCAWEMSLAASHSSSSGGPTSDMPPKKSAKKQTLTPVSSTAAGTRQTTISIPTVNTGVLSQGGLTEMICISDEEAEPSHKKAATDIICISDEDDGVKEVTRNLSVEEQVLVNAAREAANLFTGRVIFEFDLGVAMKSTDKSLHESVVTVAAECVRSYLEERSKDNNGGLDFDREYLLQLDPGWSICSIVWCGVDAFERSRRYEDASSLLTLLLGTRFLRHKRGEMFNRLALDLQHMGHDARALEVCTEALEDVFVTGGDRAAIAKRQERLSAKVAKLVNKEKIQKDEKESKPALQESGGDSDDFEMESASEKRTRRKRVRQAKAAFSKRKHTHDGTSTDVKIEEFSGSSVRDDEAIQVFGSEERKLLGLVGQREENAEIVRDHVIRGVRLGDKAVGKKSKFAGYDGVENSIGESGGVLCGVEELCLQHFGAQGGGDWLGVHCEGGCFYTLFGLLFWDVIFSSDVPDVFLTPFQDAPLDMHSYPHFFRNREAKITETLCRLESSDYTHLLHWVGTAWDENLDTICRGVNWAGYSKKFLQTIAVCVGGKGLAGICRALCVNYKHFHGGLPDLLLVKGCRRATSGGDWENLNLDQMVGGAGVRARGLAAKDEGDWEDLRLRREEAKIQKGDIIHTSKSGVEDAFLEGENLATVEDSRHLGVLLHEDFEYSFKCQMVEVKGPNDHLMERQRLWLEILFSSGIDARVCRVVEKKGSEDDL